MSDQEIKVGDVVELVSGSPPMTVSSIEEGYDAKCCLLYTSPSPRD